VAGKILYITPEQATVLLNACTDDAWKEVCDEMGQNARSHRLFRDTNGSPDKSKFVTPGVNGFYALQIVIKMLDREGVELKRENGNKSKIKQGGPWVITGNLNKNFLGPKFRHLDSKYEFDRSQGNDGFIDGTGYHISYVNRGMVHDNNIWVNDDPHLPDYRPIKALHLRLNDQGTPRLNMRPLLDKIYRVYRVVRRPSEDSATEEDGTGSDGDYTESEVDDAMETDDQPAAATVAAMETEEQPAAAGLSAAAAAAMEIDNDGAQTEESGAKSFIREGNKNDQSVYSEICVKKVYLEEKNYEVDGGKKEQRVSTLPENHTVLDLGAYTGTYAKWKLENGAGKVVCVEPNPDSLAALKTNLAAEIEDGRVIVIEKALDLDCGKTELVEKGYRSRCFPDTFPFTMGPWTDENKKEDDTYYDVETVDLQTLIDEHLPDVIKMDIEGMEAHVLTKVYDFKNARHLVFEYSLRSNQAARIQRKLHVCGWSTHSWQPCVFKVHEKDPQNNIDKVLHCTREPMLSQVAAKLDNIKYTKDTGREEKPEYDDVRNIVFGFKQRGGAGVLVDTTKKENEEIVKLLCKYVRTVKPDFVFSSIQISHNSIYPVHIDKNNAGLSLVVTVGDYDGGGLYVDGKPMLAHNTPHLFDGNFPHGTLPVNRDNGNYYSIVCYTRKEVFKLEETDKVRTELKELGFNLPAHGDPVPSVLTNEERKEGEKVARKNYDDVWDEDWNKQDATVQWKRRAGLTGQERKRAVEETEGASARKSKRARS
jgi:FkbM family methyltransferase